MIPLRQAWPAPGAPRPIVVIGAGSIVRTAHLPAYARAGLPVAGIVDLRMEAARDAAAAFHIPVVHATVAEAARQPDAIFDVAVPGNQIVDILECLPVGAAVLVQKPMGENLGEATRIRDVCRARQLTAALNFQLRFSPNMLALRDLIDRGVLGTITDLEVRVVDRQPWEQWPFLRGAPRLEVLYHSIHYLDAIRWFAGEPAGVHCRAVGHPAFADYPDVKSSIILDYGDRVRCSLMLNHTHAQDTAHRASMFKVEGTAGAAVVTMGVNIDYPTGAPDTLHVATAGASSWEAVPLRGSWFTHAFEGPMSNLQRFVAGEDASLVSPLDDAIKTMALVEACYRSSASAATPIPRVDGAD